MKDRFEQVRIVRQDVAYVVSERLLTKNDEQKAKIREHLQKFTPLYGGMAERLEDFVRLFPVHPTYLEVFEAISVAEKREVLKTLSAEMKRRLNDDVPQDQTGLISYDSYWEFLQGNAVLRSVPEIREVIDVSKVVENRIQQAFTKKALQPMAERIIHGLSIHRLTTDDIRRQNWPHRRGASEWPVPVRPDTGEDERFPPHHRGVVPERNDEDDERAVHHAQHGERPVLPRPPEDHRPRRQDSGQGRHAVRFATGPILLRGPDPCAGADATSRHMFVATRFGNTRSNGGSTRSHAGDTSSLAHPTNAPRPSRHGTSTCTSSSRSSRRTSRTRSLPMKCSSS